MSRGKIKDLTGKRFGRLVVLEITDERKDRCVVWKCKCDCGNICYKPSRSLISGATSSCGCLMHENIKNYGKMRAKHRMSNEKIYFAWQGMRKRCFDKNHKNYNRYGGRGIVVCEEWNKDFQSFYDYVSKLPHYGEKGYSLDRINNDGNYEPGNVRWATQKEQCNNKSKQEKSTCGNQQTIVSLISTENCTT